jgi:hypothetical protein
LGRKKGVPEARFGSAFGAFSASFASFWSALAKLKQQAAWLRREYPDAATSLREGLEELFPINRRGLSPSLMRALGSTNIIEDPNSAAPPRAGRVTRWRDGAMVKRRVAAAFVDAENSFRRILGYLWILKAVLNENQVAIREQAA